MREILVIRFGALGDLCVLGWALSRLADSQAPGSCRVTLVTKAAFAPLMAHMRGVDAVISLEGSDPAAVRRLAARLKKQRWDVVLDAHNILRSHLLLGLLGRRPDARLAKDTLARLGFMKFGRHSRCLAQSMRDRFEAMITTGVKADLMATPEPPLAHFGAAAAKNLAVSTAPILGLAPGAQWAAKRWPEENFAALLSLFGAATTGSVRIYLGPREQTWYPAGELARVVADTESAHIVQEPGLPDVARDLADTDIVVTNDSGLLHLAEAVGARVLALFGPTVREFGYFPLLSGSRVLETDMSCRPCSRNGKRPCHRGDLACLTGITPDLAMETLQTMLAKEYRK